MPGSPPSGSSPHDVPLVDRVSELTLLRQAYHGAQHGEPSVALITGEGGIGKTRLVTALLDEIGSGTGTVLRGQCVELGEPGIPYLSVRDILRAAAQVGADTAFADRAVVADELARLQLFEGMATLLADLATTRGPLVTVLEDLHWADPSTADLLRFLLPRLPAAPLLVILTARTEGLARRPHARRAIAEVTRLPGAVRIDLGAFDDAQTAEYVAAAAERLGTGLGEEVSRRIVALSSGNPFYAQSLLRAVHAGQGLDRRGSGGDMLSHVVLGRVDALSPAAQTVLRCAAVAGGPIPHDVLRRVSGLAEEVLRDALREVLDQRLLTATDERYTFGQGLVRQVIHDELLPGERSDLHAAYAEALQQHPTAGPAEISAHYAATSDSVNALVWSLRAAQDALQWPAPAEALEHLERALQLWPAVPDAPDRTGTTLSAVAIDAARAAGLAGKPHLAVEFARRAVAAAESNGGAARVSARTELARHLLTLDQPEEAVAQARAAVELAADSTEPAIAAQGMLARTLLAARDTDAARPVAELALGEARRATLPVVELDMLATLAFLDEIDGDERAAEARLVGALRQARACGELAAELRAHYYLASLHYYNGDITGALPVLDTALRRVDESGLRWSPSGVEIRILEVTARYVAGDLAGSVTAAALFTAPGAPAATPPDVPAARLAAVSCYPAVARGEPDVEQRFAALREVWDRDAQIGLVAGGCEADHLLWAENPLAAVEMAERAQRFLDDMLGPGMYGGLWLSALGLAALADHAAHSRRRRDAAAETDARLRGDVLLDRVERLTASGYGRPGGLGPEGRAWAVRATAEHARLHGTATPDQWGAAVDAFGFGYRYEQARCRWRLAESLLENGDRRGAEVAARAALSDAADMGAEPLRRAVHKFLESGRFDAATSGGPLTTRELEVLALVAEGLTNRQIGQRLFISEKTASVHLSNLMAKLGVSGRTEAVTVAARRGLLDVVRP